MRQKTTPCWFSKVQPKLLTHDLHVVPLASGTTAADLLFIIATNNSTLRPGHYSSCKTLIDYTVKETHKAGQPDISIASSGERFNDIIIAARFSGLHRWPQ